MAHFCYATHHKDGGYCPKGDGHKTGRHYCQTCHGEFVNIRSLHELQSHLANIPDGTTSDILSSDLEAGNFEVTHIILPYGLGEYDIQYAGSVAEGYVSPFETNMVESDL
jgi:hypothetical protein